MGPHNKRVSHIPLSHTHTHIYSTTHIYSPHTISFHHQNIPYCRKSVSGCRIDTGTLSTYKHLITNHQNYNTHITYLPNTKTSVPILLVCMFIYLKNMVADSCPPNCYSISDRTHPTGLKLSILRSEVCLMEYNLKGIVISKTTLFKYAERSQS